MLRIASIRDAISRFEWDISITLPRMLTGSMLFQGLLVKRGIFHRRFLPGKILLHTSLYECQPRVFIAVKREGPFQSPEHFFRCILVKFEARGKLRLGCVVTNRVFKASHPPDNGHGAVFQAVNLVQAARLVARRHEKYVSPSLDQMGKGVVIGYLHGERLGILLRKGRKELVVFSFASSQEDILHAESHHVLQSVCYKIKTLLVGQARDAADKQGVGPCRQTKGFFQGSLVASL